MNKAHIYIFENFDKKKKDDYLRIAFDDYCQRYDLPYDQKIIYQTKGKPVLFSHDFFFNISHSQDIYVIACAQSMIGIDIEYQRDCDFKVIAKRFFHPLERKYCQDLLHFFEVWCYKEAMVKCRGCGIDDTYSSWSVCDDEGMIKQRGNDVYQSLKIKNGYHSCIVTKGNCDIVYHRYNMSKKVVG